MRTMIAEYRIGNKGVLLMRGAFKYYVRSINHRAKTKADPIRNDYHDYSYTIAEGGKIGMMEIFYEECNFLTDVYGDMNEMEINA